ncbi:hypothetical protein PV-S19_0399 [Pacmanvirus S19]|nr:hypothetical protein PV-S19_0399 [Pacmanvirus S19]
MENTIIDTLPVELLEKIIIPFGEKPTNYMVCKQWFEFCEDLIASAFKKHKERFKPSLDEIRSIRYNIYSETIENYPIAYSGTLNVTHVHVDCFKQLSMRQYKNKASNVLIQKLLVCDSDKPVNRISMISFITGSSYYEFAGGLSFSEKEIKKRIAKKPKIIPNGPYYQYIKEYDNNGGTPRKYHSFSLKTSILQTKGFIVDMWSYDHSSHLVYHVFIGCFV